MNTEEEQQTTVSNKKKSSKSPVHLVLAFVVLLLLAATAIYVNHSKNDTPTDTAPTPVAVSPNMSLSPASQSLKIGESMTVSVWEDSGTQAVNAVQASLTYSAEEFEVTTIDASASPFGVEAPVTNTPGVLVIPRGTQGKLTGKQLVAKVTFMAKGANKAAEIKFEGSNAIVTVTDSKDILKTTTGGTYNIGAAQ